MILIVGLGNPGVEYSQTRHNIGFIILDRFLENIGSPASFFKFSSEIYKSRYNGKEVLFAKPLTFVNNSGSAVSNIAAHYNIENNDILVIHDDLDIDFGTVKLKSGGNTGGHNGLESIVSSLGDYNFNRIRFGIGRPPGKTDPAVFVLSRFRKPESKDIDFLIEKSIIEIKDYIDFGIDYAMNEHNS
jgi:PTH1 family peptidyl-tRNA hydrolase